MSDMVFELLKVAVMLAALVAARYIVPWIKDKMGADQLEMVTGWVRSTVLYAQQTMWADTGAERKAVVTKMLKEMLMAKNISISDEQLNVLIEAAVKEMKISENAGVTIMPGIEVEDDELPGIEVEDDELPDKPGVGTQVNQDGTPTCESVPQAAGA